MQITEKWQLPPFKLGMRADEEAIVELRSSRLAGLIGPLKAAPLGRTSMRKTQTQNTLTVWVFASDETRARWHTAAKFHGVKLISVGLKSSHSQLNILRFDFYIDSAMASRYLSLHLKLVTHLLFYIW